MGEFEPMRPPTAEERQDRYNRAICSSCYGAGCIVCDTSGWVCPRCLGMRFVRGNGWQSGKRVVERCEACCEGNNVSPVKEKGTILHYLEYRHSEHSEWSIREEKQRIQDDTERTYREKIKAARAEWRAKRDAARLAGGLL